MIERQEVRRPGRISPEAPPPDLIRRAHLMLLSEIESEIPIDVVKSIDELACTLDQTTSADPRGLAVRIKQRLLKNVGEHITCSIGVAANRLLAKIACKVDKPNGITIWHPPDMPAPLLLRPLSDIPGVGDAWLRASRDGTSRPSTDSSTRGPSSCVPGGGA